MEKIIQSEIKTNLPGITGGCTRGINPIGKETSLYLDLVRFLAALAVFISHVSGGRFTGGFLWQLGRFGSEAVNVFFVLSGFVIAYVVDRREGTAGDYIVSRAARIYSVAIPALVLTFILDAVGRAAHPGLYSASWGYSWGNRPEQFFSGLFFLNQIWFNKIAPGSDLPYWSLGYEVWYYILFGLVVFAPAKWRVISILAALAIMGPKLLSSFPIWLLGVACYYACTRLVISRAVGAVLCFGTMGALVAYEAWVWKMGVPVIHDAAIHTVTRNSLILDDYVIGTLFAIHLAGFHAISRLAAPVLTGPQAVIRWLAGATFTLYLFHLPVAQFLAAETPWPAGSWANRALLYLGTFLIILAIAEFTERRKDIWRRGIGVLLHGASGSLRGLAWHGKNAWNRRQLARSHGLKHG
ncbi:MAG TPA: acyltransferase [Acetobacteraceae bacterium]|nr:acyltransferase [Acetobacteraceae bacterium]